MRAVVGGVDDDGVLGDTEFVQHIEHRADVLVVVDHRVVILGLPQPRLPTTLRLGVGERVHVGEVAPHEEGVARVVLTLDVVDRGVGDVIVDGFHPLRVQRPGVLDRLLADRAELGVVRFGGLLVERLALEHAARLGQVVQPGIAVLVRVIELLRFLLGVEVVQVAEELVEAVHRGQVLVEVAEVVLAELTRRVPERLEQFGDGRVFGGPADVDAGHPHLAHSGPVHALSTDEGCAARGAALLAVGIGESHALIGDAVDVRCAIAHHAVAVAAQIADSDVVAPDDEDVRLTVRHVMPLRFRWRVVIGVLLGTIGERTTELADISPVLSEN